MLQSKYQRVGALSGVLMFLGAWLTGYYHNWVVATVSVAVVLAALWYALDDESTEEIGTRTIRGFSVGVLAALVSRILGMLTMAWTYDSWSNTTLVKYSGLSDVFRIVFNGRFWTSVVYIIGFGVAGAFIAYAMPYFSADREEE
jgi:uncharacterized membrane protein YwaF